MRLPNGYGSVYKLSGKRRNPWVARKTTGYKDNGQPIYYYVGYYETKQAALSALGSFNLNPLIPTHITMQELFDLWKEEHFPDISKSLQTSYKSGWKILAPLHDKDINEIKLEDIQRTFDRSGKNAPALVLARKVVRQVYQYAEKYEIITPDKNRIKYLEIHAGNPNKHDKTIFTETEIKNVWSSESSIKDYVLILLYTGCRIGELLNLDPSDVDIENHCFYIRKAKTAAGIRTVPISDKIYPIFENYIPYHATYGAFKKAFMKEYPDHTCHETRHTFITRMVEIGVDPRIIKTIVGHKEKDITSVYTHIKNDVLLDAVNRLT